MVSVPKSWPGETVVILATGPSLTQDDVDFCRGKSRVIAINNAITIAPWADVLYASDARWWHWNHGVPSFTGPKWSMEHSAWGPYRAMYPDVQRLRNTGPGGLEHQPTGLKNGRNSGFAALNLAYHYGVSRIVLLGYDMQATGGRQHFWKENNGDHPNKSKSPYPMFRQRFETIVNPLKKRGIEVVNCTRKSALNCFPKAALRDVLQSVHEAVA